MLSLSVQHCVSPLLQSTAAAPIERVSRMPVKPFIALTLAFAGWCSALAVAQPLQSLQEATPAATERAHSPPLVLRSAKSPDESSAAVSTAIERMRARIRTVAQSSLTAAQKQAEYQRVLDHNTEELSNISSALGQDKPVTIDAVVKMLELMFYEEALSVAPDERTQNRVLENAPAHLEFEPLQPILIAPRQHRKQIVVTRDAEAAGIEPWWRKARVNSEALELGEVVESPGPPVKQEATEEKVKVEFGKDEAVTVEMHDDTTVLRDVEGEDGGLVLFDGLHVWIGGAVQLDAFSFDELFNASAGGESKDDTSVRRGEMIVRSTLFDWGELKLQYDLESNVWRDLYFRRVDEDKGLTVTVGNQKEPMGLDYQMGNKFGTAMERSAPATAFGSFRGAGVRINRWFDRSPEQQWIRFADQQKTYITTTLGLFGQDIEDTSDTDVALTGRITMGRDKRLGEGLHMGLSASYRQGDFDRIAPRAEVYETNRIRLASPDADEQAVVALEAMATRGSLHAQAEFYYSDYRGGDIDGEGYGGYVQGGWFITGEKRAYRPKWGLWAPLPHSEKSVFEVFARLSHTYGNDDLSSSNALTVATLGGNWYLRQFRASLNALYSEVDRDYKGQDSGVAVTARVQYLF
jgi:phosphate-selective porin